MEWLSFLKQYIQGPRWIGAIAPSSKYLAAKKVKDIEFDRASCILEYGPGKGLFTEMLLANIQPGTVLILIESNARFCQLLRKKYGHLPNVTSFMILPCMSISTYNNMDWTRLITLYLDCLLRVCLRRHHWTF
jgi:phospholipid N-methyltransferase